MKKTLFILLLLVGIFPVYSQEGWPPVGAKWHFSYQPCSIWGCSSSVKEFIYFEAVKDTMLKDTVCTKITVEYHNDKGDVKYLGDEYIFSTEDQVYNYHHGRFYLLYDFSLQVGDTVVLTLGSNCNLYNQLESDLDYLDTIPIKFRVGVKDSIEIDGSKYLFMDLDYVSRNYDGKFYLFFDYKIIIKGIGSLEFLTGKLSTPFEIGRYGPLRCYSDSTVNYTTDIPCETLTSSGKEILQHNKVWVYPNPVTNFSVIYFPNYEETDITIDITDLAGKKLTSIQTCENHSLINSEEYPAGIYIYRVYTKDEFIGSGKFIKH